MLLGEDLTTSTSPLSALGRPAASILLLEGKVWSRQSPAIFLFFLLGKFPGSSGRSRVIDTGCTRQEPTTNAPSAGWGAPGEALRGGCLLAISSTSAELRDCCDVVHQLKIKLHNFAKLTTGSSAPFETLH